MKKRANILWLTTDQQRWDTIHALGNKYIDTPNLDKLVKEGVVFENAYCQSPICTPSRASFLTGKYPSAINSNINGADNMPEHATLISKALSENGYDCGLIGKLHITSAWEGEPRTDDGFSFFEYNLSPGHDLEGNCSRYKDWLEEKGIDWHDILENDGKHSYYWYKKDAPENLRQTFWLQEKAREYFERHKDSEKPWMLCVNCYDPHPPFDAPSYLEEKYLQKNIPGPIYSDRDEEEEEKLSFVYFQSQFKTPDKKERRERASYYGMVELVDKHYGMILDSLEEMGLQDDTIVIFTSDHGETIGDHGHTHKGCRFYEGLVHVPLIISCPARFKSGIKYSGITELTDIAPTIAEIAGIDFENTTGFSLIPALEAQGSTGRTFARCEYYGVLEESGKFGASNESEADDDRYASNIHETYGEMYREGAYKICIFHDNNHGQLYKLDEDPLEENNLWDKEEYREIRDNLILKAFSSAVILSRPGQNRRGRY